MSTNEQGRAAVSTINGEGVTEVHWVDQYGIRMHYRVRTDTAAGKLDMGSVVSIGCPEVTSLFDAVLGVADPEVHDQIARAHAHAAATLRGHRAVESLVGSPDGESLAVAADMVREERAA